jgi:hypothetical protein
VNADLRVEIAQCELSDLKIMAERVGALSTVDFFNL